MISFGIEFFCSLFFAVEFLMKLSIFGFKKMVTSKSEIMNFSILFSGLFYNLCTLAIIDIPEDDFFFRLFAALRNMRLMR